MYSELISEIDKLIEASTDQIAADTARLVNINSVQGAPEAGAPFGKGPRAVLDTVLAMGREAGFACTDYGVGVVSVALKDAPPDLGIWLHGDVMPVGDGWAFPPFSATAHGGCIIGRGAADNKGQLAAMFNLFKILRSLGVSLRYTPAIYVGSNEETGMRDMFGVEGNPDAKGFLAVATPPKLSLVPDGSFPVGYGGKGGLNLTLRSRTKLHGLTLTAGQDGSPERADAVFDRADLSGYLPNCTARVEGGKTVVSSSSLPRHGANPDPNGNMITQLCAALLDAELVEEDDAYILDFCKRISKDVCGEALGIKTDHNIMGPLTVFAKRIDCTDGYCDLHLNIRYPLGITFEEIIERMTRAAEEAGFCLQNAARGVDPYLRDAESGVVKILADVANGVNGGDRKPYSMSGATYAHCLPNAYVYGASANRPPADFPAGKGGAHGIDEAVSLARLKIAMKIYARALLKLQNVDWNE
ncbi:MAG: M20/M25/M40 family metallo-hydrolase [Clostridia bacterium]|nr:M20/M25/M40 family metallo-hydrolase [Clostridia bacterium]